MSKKKEKERNSVEAGIWNVANGLRGSVDGWDFKQYVLGTMFYRQISETIAVFFDENEHKAGRVEFRYADLDDETASMARKEAIQAKGYFIPPSELFENVVKNSRNNNDLNITLSKVFTNIESSSIGSSSESNFKGLFQDFDVNSNKLGSTVENRNKILVKLLEGIAKMELSDTSDSVNDSYGDAYQFLMTMYASDAGKSGGEFFTPSDASELVTRLATVGRTRINRIYDPACGSGSLLLKSAQTLGKGNVGAFYGQEINITTYNLCRINMFVHGVGYEKFDIKHGNTLTSPMHLDDGPFDVIVSNPPYSIQWDGDENPLLINDPRFTPAGVLAPKSKADMAFIMHSLYSLDNTGSAAIVCFPGIFYRKGAEQKIRQYLVDNNVVDAIIQLPPNLFFGTSITTCIMVLKKNKKDNKTSFIDASKEFIKLSSENSLTKENIDSIVKMYVDRIDIDHKVKIAPYEEIKMRNYNLSVQTYVEQENTRTPVDIKKLNNDITKYVTDNDAFSARVNSIVATIQDEEKPNIKSIIDYPIDSLDAEYGELTNYVKITTGQRVTKTEIKKVDKYPVISGGVTPMGYFHDYNREENTVTVVRYGTAGFVNWIDTKFWANDVCYTLEPLDGVLPRYIYYVMKSKEDLLISLKTNAIPAHLQREDLASVKIYVPSLEIQEKIVDILDCFTGLVDSLSSETLARQQQYEYYRDLILSFPGD